MDISTESKNPKKRPNEGQNGQKYQKKQKKKNKQNKQVKEMEVEIQEQKAPLSNSKV